MADLFFLRIVNYNGLTYRLDVFNFPRFIISCYAIAFCLEAELNGALIYSWPQI